MNILRKYWPFRLNFLMPFIMLMVSACLLGGCTEEQPPHTQTAAPLLIYAQADISFSEPEGEIYSASNAWKTELGGVDYRFVHEIAEEDRNAAVERGAAILQRIGEFTGVWADGCSVYVRQDDYAPRVRERTLYIGLENMRNEAYCVGLAQMVFGNEMPYGLEYALGMRIAEEQGKLDDEIGDSLVEALTLCDTTPEYLDMNYACFLYAEEAELPKLQRVALAFFDDLCKSERMDLYADYSDAKYHRYLSDFLIANGKAAYDNSALDGTAFYSGGRDIPLAWENTDGVFYVYEGYTDLYHARAQEPDALNSGYGSLRDLILRYGAQTAYMREVLKDFLEEIPPVTVKFVQNKDFNYYAAAMYLHSTNEIQLYYANGFQHEYGHYLLRGRGLENWLQECVCHYYTCAAMTPELAPMWYRDMVSAQALQAKDANYAFEMEIAGQLGHPIDWYSMDDYVYDVEAYLARSGLSWTDMLLDPNSGVGAKISFYHYLTTLVSEREVLEAFWNNEPEAVFGKSWKALRENWAAQAEERFSWVES